MQATSNVLTYLIHCITDMHVGSGDANYGTIDKMVQRDAITNFPTIHSTSLKGALREHFENKWIDDDGKKKIIWIFGTEESERTNPQAGKYDFLNADLFALPVRTNYFLYALAFSKLSMDLINGKAEKLLAKKIFDCTNLSDGTLYSKQTANAVAVYAEDISLTLQNSQNIQSPFNYANVHQYAYLKENDMDEFAKNLPVHARNNIQDGTSANLWYEEIVPHQTLFVTHIIHNGEYQSDFDTALTENIVQIGGNASVGHGICKFYKL